MNDIRRIVILGSLLTIPCGCDATDDGVEPVASALKVPGVSAPMPTITRLDVLGGKRVLTSLGQGDERISAVVRLEGGDLVLGGTFDNSLGLSAQHIRPAGGTDVFIARVSAGGAVRWVRTYGGATGDTLEGLAATSTGLYAAGSFNGTADMDPGGGVKTLQAAGSSDGYVLKLDLNGAFQWADQVGGPDREVIAGIAAAPQGGVVVAGRFTGVLDVGMAMTPIVAAGDQDAFVAKIADDGTPAWLRAIGGQRREEAAGVAVDGDGAVLVAMNECETDGGERGACQVAIARLDADGDDQWTWRTEGDGQAYATGIAGVGSSVIVAGYFYDAVRFGPAGWDSSVTVTSSGGSDVFACRIGGDGVTVWTDTFGATGDDWAARVVSDGARTAIAGTFDGTVSFGGARRRSAGGYDAFSLSLDYDGAVTASSQAGGAGDDHGDDVALLAGSDVALVGSFSGAATFGLSPLPLLRTANGRDGFAVW